MPISKNPDDFVIRDLTAAPKWEPISEKHKNGHWYEFWRAPQSGVGMASVITARWSEEDEEFIWPDCEFNVLTAEALASAETDMNDNGYYLSNEFTYARPIVSPE